MACSLTFSDDGVNEQPQKIEEAENHLFSEPWEDSDLILVVEDEKFHVHRQILSLQSPVFKTMLNSQFIEATAKEIPLPGKKVNEVLDFLKLLYLKETDKINSDEYQAKGVLDLCVKCLQDVPKSKENAVKIIFLATDTVIAREDDRLDSARRACEILIKDMDLAKITEKSDFKNLSRDSLESVFVKRTERLETFIKDVYPQLVGLVEYCLYLKLESSSSSITPCFLHFPKTLPGGQLDKKVNADLLQRIRNCSTCREMIRALISSSIESEKCADPFRGPSVKSAKYSYGGNCHFDHTLITLLQDLNNVISLPTFGELGFDSRPSTFSSLRTPFGFSAGFS